jgi:hypothetical protein
MVKIEAISGIPARIQPSDQLPDGEIVSIQIYPDSNGQSPLDDISEVDYGIIPKGDPEITVTIPEDLPPAKPVIREPNRPKSPIAEKPRKNPKGAIQFI